jgi:hypothetical protein
MKLANQDELIAAYVRYTQDIQSSQVRLRPHFERLMFSLAGPAGAELLASFDAEPTRWAASTGQLQHTVQQLVLAKAAAEGPIDPFDMYPLVTPFARETFEMNHRLISATPAGIAVQRLAEEAWEGLANVSWVQIMEQCNQLTPLHATTTAAMLAPAASIEVLFSGIAAQISRLAETNYKRMLRGILIITRLLDWSDQKLKTMKDPPDTLGKVMNECRDGWQKSRPDLLPLLSTDVVTIRNAEAHASSRIDFDNQTVTFDDRHEHGDQTSGPFTAMELAELSFALQGLTMTMWAALNFKDLAHQRDLLEMGADIPNDLVEEGEKPQPTA